MTGQTSDDLCGHLDVYKSYKKSPYSSTKHSSYFQVYGELLEPYRNRKITFVEIGILNGGSLFMWRDYFGPDARIIGIELNPLAKKWEKDGFEIYIGSQSDPDFWRKFFEAVGPVDIVLDDGGHTFEQQIVTTHCCIPHIRDDGLMIVEDTHTSYFKDWGYPSPYTFVEWAKKLADNINCRFPSVKVSSLPYKNSIFSVTIFESIVSFKIDRSKCFESFPTSNGGISSDAQDYRHANTNTGQMQGRIKALGRLFPRLRSSTVVQAIVNFLFGRYIIYTTRKKLRRAGIPF